MQRDDFENRLGQGLKRWAEAGRPTVDLEAYVRAQTDVVAPPSDPASEPVVPTPRAPRRWTRWLGGLAAAAALALTLTATFPAWAGAAAGWPLVGPVVTELILKDAGLKWAYENGLIKETLAEAKLGDVSVRILGVMADARRTTVIYQVVGYSKPRWDGKPIRMGEEPASPAAGEPSVFIGTINGQGTGSWSGPTTETPVGLVGTASAPAMEADSGTIEVLVRWGEQRVTMTVEASRAAADEFSREVPVNQTIEHEGVKITVESVIYTPAETIIRYREESDSFYGPITWNPETDRKYIEVGGKRYYTIGGGASFGGLSMDAYPPVDGPITFVIPVEDRAERADLVWPLEVGATQQVGDVTITLTRARVAGREIDLQWVSDAPEGFLGISQFELIDASGKVEKSCQGGCGDGNNPYPEGKLTRHHNSTLPEGFVPVAVRATQVGRKVVGPWRFELPR